MGSALYRIVLLLHIVAAVIGFGGLLANGINNARAFRATLQEARVLLAGTQAVSKVANYGIYALLAFGIMLVSVSDGDVSFGAPFISAGFVVWFLVVGVSHGMVRPAVAGLLARAETMTDGTLESDEEASGLAKKLAIGEGLVQVLLVVALYLMIWRPGGLT